jgi:Tol biopolymer transport system component/DNA-binding winged helix-turn-helix (wHTH) protein
MLLKPDGLYVFGPYRFDARERRLLRNGQAIPLPPKAFDLLLVLVARAGSLVTKEELLAEVWAGTFVEEANLPYTISLLRKALGEDERYIETVPKRGYRFTEPVSVVAPSLANPAGAPHSRTEARTRRRMGLAAVVMLLGVALWSLSRDGFISNPRSGEVATVPLTSFGGLAKMPRLSPDGKRVVYQWDGRRKEDDAPNWDIYVQSIEAGDPLPLTSSVEAECCPVWSPDGERIAFIKSVGGNRYAIHAKPAMGGAEQPLTPSSVHPAPRSIDWSPDGQTLAFTLQSNGPNPDGIALLSLDTGLVKQLTSPPAGSIVDRVPRFSPDRLTLAFIRNATIAGPLGDLYTIGLAGGVERQITSGNRPIDGVDWTSDGKELVFSSNRTGQWTLWRVATASSDADPVRLAGAGTDASFPTVARKANRLAYQEQRQDRDIWRASVSLGDDGAGTGLGSPSPVQASTRGDVSPQISPDGRQLVFVSDRSGDQAIWISDVDGLNAYRIASFPGYPAGSPRWSPTGTRVTFDASIAGHADVFVVDRLGGKPVHLTSELADNIVPSWSRDEKWIYFSSDRTGRYEIWKVLSGGGTAIKVTKNGGFAPFESHDGQYIYYVRGLGLGGIWRMPVKGGEEVFILDGPTPGYWGYWALLRDGICFATQGANLRASASVQYFDFKNRKTIILGDLGAAAIPSNPFFALSPDQRSIFYVKTKPATSDIVLVKNFR